MMGPSISFFSDEYNSLRAELESNKKFVFERPLIIIATGLAITGTLYDAEALVFAPIPFLTLLYFNLWFTQNRLRSSARIVAYLQLAHETRQLKTPGWESALRIYRKTKIALDNDKLKVDTDYDNLSFYSPIFHFHVWLGAFVAAAMNFGALVTYEEAVNPIFISLFIFNFAFIIAYVFASFKFPLKAIHSEIERDRLRWIQALTKNSDKRKRADS